MTRQRPSILLILQDQLRYDVVHDPSLCSTPVQDELRRQGTSFLNHYAPLGICSPSRASMLTGLYPHGHGVLNNLNGSDAFVHNLPTDNLIVSQLLQKQGYRTGYVGKWHLGREDGPDTRGFDDVRAMDHELAGERFRDYWGRFFGQTPDVVMTRYPPAISPRYAESFERRPFPIYSTETLPEDTIPARTVLDGATELLREFAAGDTPFFLVASFIEPHWPNILPEPYASMYDPADMKPWPNLADSFEGKPRTLQAGLEHFGVADFTWDDWAPIIAKYFGAVSFIDDLVGRLIGSLDELGLGDDTMLVSSCDHGDMIGAHGQFNKGPLMYEEVYHIPFTVRWPGVAAAGATVDGLTSHIDLMPSVLEAATAPVPDGLHGQSFLPLLRGDSSGWRESLVSEFHGDEFGLYTQRMLRHGRFKLIYNANDIRELYDLEADPYELNNLAFDPGYAELRSELEVRLLELMHEFDDPHRLWAVNTLG